MRSSPIIIFGCLCLRFGLPSLGAQPLPEVDRFAQRAAKSVKDAHHSRILIAYSPYCYDEISACVAVQSALRTSVSQSVPNAEFIDQADVWAAVRKHGFDVVDLNSGPTLKETNPELSFDTLVLESVVPPGSASSSSSGVVLKNQTIEINCAVFDVSTSQFLAEYDIDLDPRKLPQLPLPTTSAEAFQSAFPETTIPIGRAAVAPKCMACQAPTGSQINASGNVNALVTITTEGRVVNVTVLNSTLKADLNKAIQTFATWRFVPAKDKAGNPIAVITAFQLKFRKT